MCMSYACHQLMHIACMLHACNMCLPCTCHVHVRENNSSYKGVATSELIFLIPIYVWAEYVTSLSYTPICKIGKKSKFKASCTNIHTTCACYTVLGVIRDSEVISDKTRNLILSGNNVNIAIA